MVRILTAFGITLILLGAVVLAGPTFAFSTTAADRAVGITTAEDDNAAISIVTDNVYNDERITIEESQPLINIGNNFDQRVGGDDGTVRVEVEDVSGDIDDDDVIEMDSDPTIDPDEDTDIEFICRSDEPSGTNTIDVLLDVSEVSGASVSVENRLLDEQIEGVEIQCNQGEQTESGLRNVAVSDLADDQTDEDQTIEFELTEALPEDESVTITLERATGGNRIDYSDASFNGEWSDATEAETSGNDYEITFDPEETLEDGETITITIENIDTTGNSADGEYDANFDRSDKDSSEELEPAFEVE